MHAEIAINFALFVVLLPASSRRYSIFLVPQTSSLLTFSRHRISPAPVTNPSEAYTHFIQGIEVAFARSTVASFSRVRSSVVRVVRVDREAEDAPCEARNDTISFHIDLKLFGFLHSRLSCQACDQAT